MVLFIVLFLCPREQSLIVLVVVLGQRDQVIGGKAILDLIRLQKKAIHVNRLFTGNLCGKQV